jgi:hypothetical protein
MNIDANSLRGGDTLPVIEETEVDNISIMSDSPEENNVDEEYAKKNETEAEPEAEVEPKPSGIDNDEKLSEESSPSGKIENETEDENSLEYKDEIIVSDTDTVESKQKNVSPTSAPTPVSPSENLTENCENDEQDVLYFTDANPVSVADNFLKMKKQGGVYFVPFKTPLIVQTPVFKLTEPLNSGSVTLKITKGFATFVKEIEQTILNAAFVNKSTWFRTELTDEIITDGFKSFMNEYDLKVKVSEELTSFDDEGNYIENNFKTPVGVRCILELSGICFGKLEFGAMFTLTQVQTTKIPKCAINASREKRTNVTSFSGDFV